MDLFKKLRFEKEHPGIVFPTVIPLNDSEMREIRIRLATKVGFPPEVDNLALTHHIASVLSPVRRVNAEDPGFDLRQIFHTLRIQTPQRVYINWYRYDRIDQMQFDDLVTFFADLWYPSSDDIEILDSTLMWLLAIDHSGDIGYTRLG